MCSARIVLALAGFHVRQVNKLFSHPHGCTISDWYLLTVCCKELPGKQRRAVHVTPRPLVTSHLVQPKLIHHQYDTTARESIQNHTYTGHRLHTGDLLEPHYSRAFKITVGSRPLRPLILLKLTSKLDFQRFQ